MIDIIWMSESSILLLLETEVLTSKSCNTLWKKSMHGHMWLIIFVVPRCNYFFVFFLDIFTLKTVNLYAVYLWSHLPGTIKLLHYALIYSSLMITYFVKNLANKRFSSEVYVFFADSQGDDFILRLSEITTRCGAILSNIKVEYS